MKKRMSMLARGLIIRFVLFFTVHLFTDFFGKSQIMLRVHKFSLTTQIHNLVIT